MEKIDRIDLSETVLRLLSVALCIVALVVMFKNSETNDFGSLSYSSLGAYMYLLYANGVCAAYSLLTAFLVAIPHPTSMPRAWIFLLLDQVFTYVALGAGAVSAQVLDLAYNGNSTLTWSSTCDSYSRFCYTALSSVVITFAVAVLYMLLSSVSSYRLFSKYDPPMTQNCCPGTAVPDPRS